MEITSLVNTMSIYRLVLLALCASAACGRPVQMSVRHRLLSAVTGRYLSVTKSGRVHGNGAINLANPEKDATPIVIDRLTEQSRTRVASVKYAGKFLVVTPEGRVRAQVPEDGNEILEEIHLPDRFMALRFVNYRRIVGGADEGSGSEGALEDGGLLVPHSATGGEEASQQECFIGFSTETGRAQCFPDTSSVNVRLHIIPNE